MSIYSKFQSNSDTFNSSDIMGQNENNRISLDLSGFVNANNPVFSNDIYLKPNVKVKFGNVLH